MKESCRYWTRLSQWINVKYVRIFDFIYGNRRVGSFNCNFNFPYPPSSPTPSPSIDIKFFRCKTLLDALSILDVVVYDRVR